MITVSLPDGTRVGFPDGTTKERMAELLNRDAERLGLRGGRGQEQVPLDRAQLDQLHPLDRVRFDLMMRQQSQQPLSGYWTDPRLPPADRMALLAQDRAARGEPTGWRAFTESLRGAGNYVARRSFFPVPTPGVNLLPPGDAFIAHENRLIHEALQRYDAGNPTGEDLVILKDALEEQDREARKGVVRQAWDTATMLPKYGAGFMSGGFLARPAAAGMRGAMGRMLPSKLPTTLAKGLTEGAAKTTNVFVRASAQVGRTTANYSERQLTPQGYRNVGKAFLLAYGDNLIETISELSAPFLGRAVGAVARRLPKSKFYADALEGLFHSRGVSSSAVARALDQWGIHRVVGELAEERVGDVLRGATGVEDDYGVFSMSANKALRQLQVELLAFSIPGALRRVAGVMGPPRGMSMEEMEAQVLEAWGQLETAIEQRIQAEEEGAPTTVTSAPGETLSAAEPVTAPRRQRVTPEQLASPEAFLEAHPETVQRLAALPESPSRTQFASASGIHRDDVTRGMLKGFVAEARVRQGVSEALELGPRETSAPKAPASRALPQASFVDRVRVMTEPQRRTLLSSPEAQHEWRAGLNKLSGIQIARKFGLNPNRRKQEMIDQLVRQYEPGPQATVAKAPEKTTATPRPARQPVQQVAAQSTRSDPSASQPPRKATPKILERRMRRLENWFKQKGRPVRRVDPKTKLHSDVAAFGKRLGVEVGFFETDAEIDLVGGAFYGKGVALIDSRLGVDALWGVAGHEIAHATNIDTLRKEFPAEVVDRYSREYYDGAADDLKKMLDKNPDRLHREGVAMLVDKFMQDPKLRDSLFRTQPSVFRRIVNRLLAMFKDAPANSREMRAVKKLIEEQAARVRPHTPFAERIAQKGSRQARRSERKPTTSPSATKAQETEEAAETPPEPATTPPLREPVSSTQLAATRRSTPDEPPLNRPNVQPSEILANAKVAKALAEHVETLKPGRSFPMRVFGQLTGISPKVYQGEYRELVDQTIEQLLERHPESIVKGTEPWFSPQPIDENGPYAEVPTRGQRPQTLPTPSGKAGQLAFRASDILRQLESLGNEFHANARVRVGHMGRVSKSTQGLYKPQWDVARLRAADDIDTAAHEIAHAIDFKSFVTVDRAGNPLMGAGADAAWAQLLRGQVGAIHELESLGRALYGNKVPAAGYAREGFAEYVRLALAQPADAKKRAPKFDEFFRRQIAGTKAETEWNKAGEMIRQWDDAGSVARAEASIVDPGSWREWFRRMRRRKWRQTLTTEFVEALDPLRLFDEAYEKRASELAAQLGKPAQKLTPEESTYARASALRMVAAGRVEYMVEHGMMDFTGNPINSIPALSAIRNLIGEKDAKKFGVYLYARRTLSLVGDPQRQHDESAADFAERQDRAAKLPLRASGLSEADARRIIQELDSDAFRKAARLVYDWNAGVLNYVAGASPVMAEQFNTIRSVDPGDYIPLARYFDELDEVSHRIGTSVRTGSLSARLMGSGRPIKDPFQMMISNAQHLVQAAHARSTVDRLTRAAESGVGMGDLMERVPRDLEVKFRALNRELLERIKHDLVYVDPQTGKPVMNVADLGEIDVALEELVTFFGPRDIYRGPQPILSIRDASGQWQWWQVDERLMKVLNDTTPGVLGPESHMAARAFIEFLRKQNQVFKTGAVGVRAGFSLVTNPARDFQTFMVNTTGNPAQAFAAYMQTLNELTELALTGKHSEFIDLFNRLGLKMTQPFGEDINRTRRAARNLFKGKTARVVDPFNAWDTVRELMQFPEAAPRIAEMKITAKRLGWDPSMPLTEGIMIELMRSAKQITVDFTAAGHTARVLNQFLTFFNVSIQAPRTMGRVIQRDPVAFLMRAGSLSALALANWWINKDEDWWVEGDDRKFLYHTIPFTHPLTGEKELLLIPRDYETGVIFSAIPVALADAFYRQDPELAVEGFQAYFNVATPNLLPVMAREMRQQWRNIDDFTKHPIVPKNLLDAPPSQQVTQYTSRGAKVIGQIIQRTTGQEISPARIEHFIRGNIGPAFTDVMKALDSIIDDREKTLSDTPILGRLFMRGGPLGYRPRSIDRLYEAQRQSLRRMNDTQTPETSDERHKRLLLTDATRAVSHLVALRGMVREERGRRELTVEALSIARDALAEVQKESPLRERFVIARRRAEAQRQAEQRMRDGGR